MRTGEPGRVVTGGSLTSVDREDPTVRLLVLLCSSVLAVALAVAGLTLLPALPAAAQTGGCLPAGGASIPPADPDRAADFSFTGRGWGHGAGMSQYGARGAARLGCTAEQILQTYYQGVTLVTEPMPTGIRVGLFESAASINVTAEDGAVPWEVCDGACEDLPTQPQGAQWNLAQEAAGTEQVLRDGGPDGTEVWRGGSADATVRALFDGTTISLTSTGHEYRRGVLEFASNDGGRDAMTVVVVVPDMEAYLYGLAEMPSSWESAALEAQAIAGRSYALARVERRRANPLACRCDLYGSTLDQAYSGWTKESEGTDAQFGRRWVAAVEATRAQVLTHGGEPIDAYYSSSHGGYSESARFVFGGEVPYVQPVDDSRWDLASGVQGEGGNPYRTWVVGVSAEQLGAAAGVGVATSVELPEPKGNAGRVGHPSRGFGGAVITGTTGRVTFTGDDVRRALGLRSTLFTVSQGDDQQPPSEPPPSEPPLPTDPPATVDRVSGNDRISTAVSVSETYWDSAGTALLATSGGFADALSAGALAASLGGPLLLTGPDELPDVVAGELRRLGVVTVLVLGGPAVVSPIVEQQLVADGFRVERLAGENRFETARQVALEVGPDPNSEVTVVLGDDWPDAVGAGALAATPLRTPTLLTARDRLPAATATALAELGTERVTLVGGTVAISAAVEAELESLGYVTTRLAGTDRFGTSAEVVDAALDDVGSPATAVFASGENFPDALSAAALAARIGGTLVLVPRQDLANAPAIAALLDEHAEQLGDGIIVGGTGAVSERVRAQLADRL